MKVKSTFAHLIKEDLHKVFFYKLVKRTWAERIRSDFWEPYKIMKRWRDETPDI